MKTTILAVVSPKSSEPPPRRRRSSDEVRRHILDAGASLFAERGFDGTTTRQIASRAGVVEPLVFRHFGSKAGLLEAVVVEPLSAFVEQFANRWQVEMRTTRKLEARVRDFVGQLYDLLAANRNVVVNLLLAGGSTNDGEHLAAPLDRLFDTMCDVSRFAGYPGDPAMNVRLTFGQVVSVVVFDRWLWPSGRPSRDEIIDALTADLLPTLRHAPRPSDASGQIEL